MGNDLTTMKTLKHIYASAYAATIAILSVTTMTIVADLHIPFKNWLAHFTGHHWVTKSWASIIIFALFFGVFTFLSGTVDERRTRRALTTTLTMTVIGTVAILGFYFYEFFSH